MIGDRRVLAIVPARGGSKGLPRKNLRPLRGRPLVAWSIAAASGSRYVDRIVVSTEDDEIAEVARAEGADVPFPRPPELATDTAHAVEVVDHVVRTLASSGDPYDYLLFLEPTSPLRTSADVDAALELLLRNDGDYCVSVMETHERPEWMFFINEKRQLNPAIGRFDARPRQLLPPVYRLNGAVYAARVSAFLRDQSLTNESSYAHVMPLERSVDIDGLDDLLRAEAILAAALGPS